MKRISRLLLLAAVVASISASFGCAWHRPPGQSGYAAYQAPVDHPVDSQHDADFP